MDIITHGITHGIVLDLRIGGRLFPFEVSHAELINQATSPSGLDTWAVQVATLPGAEAQFFTYKIGTLGRDIGPDPLGVAISIAGDLASAIGDRWRPRANLDNRR
jgi:hypothetical protein